MSVPSRTQTAARHALWLAGLLVVLGSVLGSGDDAGGMNHGSDEPADGQDMAGMSEEDLSRLEAASGAAFDRMFLQMMVLHHEGAVEVAMTVQEKAKDAEVRALAAQIEADQNVEITQMRKLLSS